MTCSSLTLFYWTCPSRADQVYPWSQHITLLVIYPAYYTTSCSHYAMSRGQTHTVQHMHISAHSWKHLYVHISSVDRADVTVRYSPGDSISSYHKGNDGDWRMQRWVGSRQDKWQAPTGIQLLWRRSGSPLEQGSDSTPQGLHMTFSTT